MVLECVELCARGWVDWRLVVLLVGLRAFAVVCFMLGVSRWVCVQDGQSVVSGSADNSVRVWDAATGKETQKLEGHSSAVRSVAFSPVLSWKEALVLARVLASVVCAVR